MKQIKRIALLMALVLSVVVFAGCSTQKGKQESTSTSSKVAVEKVTVEVKIGDDVNKYKVKKNERLMILAKTQLDAKEDKGMLAEVGKMATDAKNKSYLMFKVNGKDSNVGAKDVKLKDGDNVEFYLSKF